jgi:hypothetical protein
MEEMKDKPLDGVTFLANRETPFTKWMEANGAINGANSEYPEHIQKAASEFINEAGIPGSAARTEAEFNDICADLMTAEAEAPEGSRVQFGNVGGHRVEFVMLPDIDDE